ncbi:MAG: hypothetical protein N2109_07060 [Fimbriimonadales bacterium]|nr:hypothetical protein [Fimbriimonadales bacterium]
MEGTVDIAYVRALREAALGQQMQEGRAAALLAELLDKYVDRPEGRLPALCIITSDRVAEGDGRTPAVNRIMGVQRIDTERSQRIYEWPDGRLEKVEVVVFVAVSEDYTTADGRRVHDEVRSGPEELYIDDSGKVFQHGAATALLARLLEYAAWLPQDLKGISVAMFSSTAALRSVLPERE